MTDSKQQETAKKRKQIDQLQMFYQQCGRLNVQLNFSDELLLKHDGNAIIGAVRLCYEEGTHLLRTMQIAEKYQGQGYARTLLYDFYHRLMERNIDEVYLIAYGHLERFYGTIGFRKIGRADAPRFLKDRADQSESAKPEQRLIVMKLERKSTFHTFYDAKTLRDVCSDLAALNAYIQTLKTELAILTASQNSSIADQVTLLGEIAVCLRQAGDLEEAERKLRTALDLIAKESLGIRYEVQQKIRLGHVWQWQKRFHLSNALFEELIEICRWDPQCKAYLPFALQHAGKNYFEQTRYPEALSCFEEALQMRLNANAPLDQIESSRLAVQTTRSNF